MSTDSRRAAFIDIGSNTVRLMIVEGAVQRRIIEEKKFTIRLAAHVDHGTLSKTGMHILVEVLRIFQKRCQAHAVSSIRAVATAAIRNANNHAEVLAYVKEQTQLELELLSGIEEARIGFLGVIHSTKLAHGYVIDIGGGSTEISYFAERELRHSMSIPIGAVNGHMNSQLVADVQQYMKQSPWLLQHPQLPVIGLGGTCRTAAKMDQGIKQYSYPLVHHYEMSVAAVTHLTEWIVPLPLAERKQIKNLNKERADIIAAGLLILQTVLSTLQSSTLMVSAAGLRDGLYYEWATSQQWLTDDPVERTVQRLLAQFPIDRNEVEPIKRWSDSLYRQLYEDEQEQQLLRMAAHLYAIGKRIDVSSYYKHTYYLLTQVRIDGYSHREQLCLAFIASFRSKNKTRPLMQQHKDILSVRDEQMIVRLGSILLFAIQLQQRLVDPSSDFHFTYQAEQRRLQLMMDGPAPSALMRTELAAITRDFCKLHQLQSDLLLAREAE